MAGVMKETSQEQRALFLHETVGGASPLVPAWVRKRVYDTPWLAPLVDWVLARTAAARRSCMTVAEGALAGTRLFVDLRSERMYWDGTHEFEVQEALAEHVKPEMVAYDVGAHIGFFALLLSKIVGPKGLVYAFEPSPPNYAVLVRNIRINRCRNIKPVRLGVSAGEGALELSPEETCACVVRGNRATRRKRTVRADATSIDDFVFKAGNRPPDLVKIDVEGAGGGVLRGIRRIAKVVRPMVIMEVHTEDERAGVEELASESSYRVDVLEAKPKGTFWQRAELPFHALARPR